MVSALASGRGAAISVDLRVEVEVELTSNSSDIEVETSGHEPEDEVLVRTVTSDALRWAGPHGLGVRLHIDSEIPIGVGLKSSSAVSNALLLALASELGEEVDDMELVEQGVESSKKAGVSVTGALDDALASYLGGLVVTDNEEMELLHRQDVDDGLMVVLKIPNHAAYTRDVDVEKLRRYASIVDEVHGYALGGDVWTALTLNGLVYASPLGVDSEDLLDAVDAGALAAGISGSGPALAAVCTPENVEEVKSVWYRDGGEVRVVGVNNSRAGVI